MILLQIIGGLLLAVILLAVLWPFRYKIEYTYEENLDYQIAAGAPVFSYRIDNLAGQQESRIKVFGIHLPSAKEKKKEKSKSYSEKKTEKTSKKILEKLKLIFCDDIYSRKNFVHIYGLFRSVFSLLKPKYYSFNITVGLPEPDLNGLLLAFYYSLKSPRSQFPVFLQINWEREVIESRGIISGSVIPLRLLWQLLRFLLSPKTLKLLWQIRRQQKAESV